MRAGVYVRIYDKNGSEWEYLAPAGQAGSLGNLISLRCSLSEVSAYAPESHKGLAVSLSHRYPGMVPQEGWPSGVLPGMQIVYIHLDGKRELLKAFMHHPVHVHYRVTEVPRELSF